MKLIQPQSHLYNACFGKSASRNGMNIPEFRKELKLTYPEAKTIIDSATNRKELEELCKKLMSGIKEDLPKIQEKTKTITQYHELPKEFCQDYTLEELITKSGQNIKLTSADRERVCRELRLPNYQIIKNESLGYPRDKMLEIAAKIENGEELNETEDRIVQQWNRNHEPLKTQLDDLAKKFISGERLSPNELKILDRELFNKYCRCVLKRKTQDRKLLATRDIDKIFSRLNPDGRIKAQKILDEANKSWNIMNNREKDQILEKILPMFLSLGIGGCKSSVYMKSRKIKSRNRACDYDLNAAEILFENKKK